MRYDAIIVGSGFAGNLLGWILAECGWRVLIVDREEHPRFAIGESSTPLGDMLLERLADHYGLTALKPLARWGTCRQALPQLRVGKKRGFSYFQHLPGKPFADTPAHDHSLMVAASASDASSDLHWMRSDVDAWLYQQACQAGCAGRLGVEVINLQRDGAGWTLTAQDRAEQGGEIEQWECREFIDATGSSDVAVRYLGLNDASERLLTRTGCLFGHFRGVAGFADWLEEHGLADASPIFNPDDAAQHHLLGNAWMWMLRFVDGTTSVGFVQPTSQWGTFGDLACKSGRMDAWQILLARYPSIYDLMHNANLVAPTQYGRPVLGWQPRISRMVTSAAGKGWALLPATAGVIDPMHSTGIAHGLWGVWRVARFLLSGSLADRSEYGRTVAAELQWIDRLVAAAYRGMPHGMDLFAAAASFYFLAAIHSERRLAQQGQLPQGFLMHRDDQLQAAVNWFLQELGSAPQSMARADRHRIISAVRQRIAPWNDVGLLDPALGNRIARAAAPK